VELGIAITTWQLELPASRHALRAMQSLVRRRAAPMETRSAQQRARLQRATLGRAALHPIVVRAARLDIQAPVHGPARRGLRALWQVATLGRAEPHPIVACAT
jgi:hypothetical protein